MKKFTALLTFFFAFNCFCQEDQLLQLTKIIQNDTTFELNYLKLNRYNRKMAKNEKSKKDHSFIQEKKENLDVFLLSEILADSLIKIEKNNFNNDKLLPRTYKILHSYDDLKSLVALLKMIEIQYFPDSSHDQIVRNKLIEAISIQMQTMAENTMPFYNYPISKKRWLKGVQIETANDLFRFGIFQKNNDMDYTGALKISFITDLFKMDAFRPTQSYQVISYGGEVYTPYFRDTNIFITEDTFNIYDRPHACFQYIGIENHGIAENFRSRWSTNVRVGLIGSRFGYNFQYFLHRDISTSPFPTGWDAQIGFPGRLALQLNVKYEHLWLNRQADFETMKRNSKKFRVVPSSSAEISVGHFMTYAQIGGNISTLNFKNQNQMSVLPKSFNKLNGKKIKSIMPFSDLDVALRYVVHNSTLTGFGVFCSKEEEKGAFAEKSKYYLPTNRVNPFVLFINWRFGVQLEKFNFFYRSSIKTPEYKSDGFIYTQNGETLNPNTRWHHYASIGVSFII